ncbi:hypothetical protein C8A00DRAFT_31537 [Chaetomidium leptoderma]|uniref:Rhodopsin domain-containing protein n=1 Tax=Chaetomidium leptoderma TaxID=669021 RepID=A0AAN6ZZ71_9PEZI|nr:hypothetical protein C8A00DRAFT_31537 [Chaetomidium leptoderma]
MSPAVVTETGYTKFNLSYPAAMANATAVSDSDRVDDASTIPGVLFGILVPHIVCTLFIAARTWSRLFLLRKWFLDDTLILLAWTFSTAVCIIYTISTQQSRHDHDPHDYAPPSSSSSPEPSAIRTYTSLILYQLTLLLTKLSILAFYHRIFSPSTTSSSPKPPPSSSSSPSSSSATAAAAVTLERTLTRLTTQLVLLYGLPLLALSLLQCHPTAGQFFGRRMDKCVAFAPLLVASTALHTATDAWLIVLVVPCVWRLAGVSPRQRVVLGGVLSLGVFVIVVGLVRLRVSLGGLGAAATAPAIGGVDGGRRVAETLAFFVLTVLELDVALICASAPTLRPVLVRVWPRLGMGEQNLRQGGGGGGGGGREGSVDLTSGVSYHGYPWTRNATPVGSKNTSVVDVGVQGAGSVPPVPPPPPVAMLMHRTPTTLSLRSFVSGITLRSWGRLEGEDRTGLLGDENQGAADGVASRRRSSVGYEAYYEQFVGDEGSVEKRGSRCGARAEARHSRGSQCYSGRWGDSQESFVLGVNDPQSPKRLSPVSGLSEVTKAELRRHGSNDEKEVVD